LHPTRDGDDDDDDDDDYDDYDDDGRFCSGLKASSRLVGADTKFNPYKLLQSNKTWWGETM